MQTAKFVAALLALSCFSAIAAPIPTEDMLAEVAAETVMLKAQAKREDARQDLAAKAGGLGDSGGLPTIRRVDRVNDEPPVAELIFAGNVKVEARQGTKLPGGYRVEAIDMKARTVDVSRGKERYTIGMSASGPQPTQPKSVPAIAPGMAGPMFAAPSAAAR